MKRLTLTATVFLLLTCAVMAQKKSIELFNGKNLDGWDTYIGAKDENSERYGLNNDPEKVFSVVTRNGESLLRISGDINGALATGEEYENYHLKLIFKWGDKVAKSRNSGLLYHSFGNFGEGLGIWMSSHELQLWTEHIGDSYCMGNSYFEIPAVKSADGKSYVYDAKGGMTKFGEGQASKICSKNLDNEKPVGEWNVVELYCFGGTAVHVVNGKVNMINYNSGKLVNGKMLPLAKGKIQLQSEGGELFVRKMTLTKIDKIPEHLLK